jgi:hypothetical protein
MSTAKTRDGCGRRDGRRVLLRERIYSGVDRFADDLKHPALRCFANWRTVP